VVLQAVALPPIALRQYLPAKLRPSPSAFSCWGHPTVVVVVVAVLTSPAHRNGLPTSVGPLLHIPGSPFAGPRASPCMVLDAATSRRSPALRSRCSAASFRGPALVKSVCRTWQFCTRKINCGTDHDKPKVTLKGRKQWTNSSQQHQRAESAKTELKSHYREMGTYHLPIRISAATGTIEDEGARATGMVPQISSGPWEGACGERWRGVPAGDPGRMTS